MKISARILLYTLIFFFFLFFVQTNAFAKENISPSPSASPSASASASGTIKYELAYPGILPDNPLYKLKVLRDKISAALITDPRKKIEFYLLQTDKGMLAAAMLVDKGKIDLASQTALKAEHNYTLLTQQLYRLPDSPDDALFIKLKTASLKHQEVLASLVKRTPKDKQKTFLTVIDFSKRNWDQINKFKEQKEEEEEEQEEIEN